ncbi:hypothetical protein IMZ31_24140 (plasmid) [Pontibacillus sp. ALD_SL1]|uniref:hypothetical protein n=1 Tax=Pontibacillus sp. ALD_SL1 TaxID=2777185 RepID=UPI001A975867|nr:hypothetical protein [Pontibacillus sp. ALD_SL1]QST02543.1 hypothetical protein IMZ31_24140 [Pontibacillus sp. ALD_SL1]
MDKLYVYYHCDQWKMTNSYHLVGVFTEDKVKEVVIKDLRKGDVECSDRDEDEIIKMDIRTLDTLLVYGHIQPVELNVEV